MKTIMTTLQLKHNRQRLLHELKGIEEEIDNKYWELLREHAELVIQEKNLATPLRVCDVEPTEHPEKQLDMILLIESILRKNA